MSRTDRDAPYWARATWWAPLHRCAALCTTEYPGRARLARCLRTATTATGTRLGRRLAPRTAQCDLPAVPDLRQHLTTGTPTRCMWRPIGERLPWAQDGPTRRFVLTTWTRPQRARVRDQCHLAVQHHRATGIVDVEPTTEDHRHNARWHW
ncbi:hypothetical protein [Dactylosporangium salmoneum]|uniref:Uncharacterized protein n=1 Tax=Dactylosporangium salmoneum TaxID=53361 RepID=A0ABN3G2J2_9ACTN